MKAEYLYCQAILGSADGPSCLLPEVDDSFLGESASSLPKRIYLWSIGQPELALRFSRQILVNNIDQIDEPLHLRRRIVRPRYPMLIELDPTQKLLPGQLNAGQLNSALEGSFGRRLIQLSLFFRLGEEDDGYSGLDKAYRLDGATVAMAGVVLAAHEFFRAHGEFPDNLGQLVPEYLASVPFDPMSSMGASLQYRRESLNRAKVWSIGNDEVDNGGDIERNESRDRGYRIFVMDSLEAGHEKTTPESSGAASETAQ
jgi:hypothetical protein